MPMVRCRQSDVDDLRSISSQSVCPPLPMPSPNCADSPKASNQSSCLVSHNRSSHQYKPSRHPHPWLPPLPSQSQACSLPNTFLLARKSHLAHTPHSLYRTCSASLPKSCYTLQRSGQPDALAKCNSIHRSDSAYCSHSDLPRGFSCLSAKGG